MTYLPRRDERFEYIGDAMEHIETKQCFKCILRDKDDQEMPMCYEISTFIILEAPVHAIDDLGDAGLNCRKFVLDMAYIDPVD